MKYLIYTLAILCLGISTSWAFPDFTFPDFRLSKWGDTKEQVLAVEPETLTPLDDNPDVLFATTRILGHNVGLAYKFVGEKLVAADYLFGSPPMTPAAYQNLFDRMRNLLSAKYTTGPYSGRFYIGQAASIASWTTPSTTIWLVYDSGFEVLPFSIAYGSREFNYLTLPDFEMEEF